MYKCNNKKCGHIFEYAHTVKEIHNMNIPPFERIAVCPNCGSDDFSEIRNVDKRIDKIDVAQTVIPALAWLHNFRDRLLESTGIPIDSDNDLNDNIWKLQDMLIDMVDPDTDKFIYSMRSAKTDEDAEKCIALFGEELNL